MSKADKVAECLKYAGIKIVKIHKSSFPDVEDDAVFLENDRHVSIGYDYLSLVEEKDGCFKFYKEVETARDLILLIKSLK